MQQGDSLSQGQNSLSQGQSSQEQLTKADMDQEILRSSSLPLPMTPDNKNPTRSDTDVSSQRQNDVVKQEIYNIIGEVLNKPEVVSTFTEVLLPKISEIVKEEVSNGIEQKLELIKSKIEDLELSVIKESTTREDGIKIFKLLKTRS